MPSCSLIRLLQGMDSCSTGSSSSCSQSRLLQRLGCGGGKGRSCSQCLRLELCFEFRHGQKTQKENLSGMTTASGHAHLLRGKPIIGKKLMAVSTHLFPSVGQTWELDKADAHLEMKSLKQFPEASISVCHVFVPSPSCSNDCFAPRVKTSWVNLSQDDLEGAQ